MSDVIYDFNYYELIQPHLDKWELPCLVLAKYKLTQSLGRLWRTETKQEHELKTWFKTTGEKA